MKIINYSDNNNYKIIEKGKLNYIALGFFDGIHLGHQTILKLCVDEAQKVNAVSTAILFEPHPDKVIHGLKKYYLLTPLEERIKKIENLNVQQIIVINFNNKFQKITAENFIVNILLKKFNMGAVFVGYNYHFGFKKRGNTELIKKYGYDYNYKTYIINKKTINGFYNISSTIIKKLLKEGDIESANKLLGYHYEIIGKVVHGDKRGSTALSFPTANLEINDEKLLPKNGVYVAFATFGDKKYRSLVNIGFRPTIKQKNKNISVEVFIFDFCDEIYNDILSINLLKRIRSEKCLASLNDLASQIEKDKIKAELYFKNICSK
ncbi:MAG: riboflavin biosynthesis protein RibF [Candidatus Caldatribacteriota bacterium]|nr:riboflavin biosynthesis protein RibF [Atribacterota bacterium]MDD3640474.1 riboflavin biosynthesis protein RibF [Atribacterota bacterium]MDD4764504.1 riboflavin biosynthesis protein RibF [Atribacterota bacterium]MDD5635356.1 riboflavin biosynthesis protein RibF [Atribacterota bacterium]